jgi:hypothetical protein
MRLTLLTTSLPAPAAIGQNRVSSSWQKPLSTQLIGQAACAVLCGMESLNRDASSAMHKARSTLILFAVLFLIPPQAADQAYAQLQPVESGQSAARPQMPGADQMMILLRTSLIALHHANMTGNYTVLRDIGAPGFQEANDPARLSAIFADLRDRDHDLGPVSILDATLTREPAFENNGMLRLTGVFPTRPEQVNFDLLFENVQGNWRLFGISVGTSRAEPAAANDRPSPDAQAEPPAVREQAQPPAAPSSGGSPLVEEAQRLLTRLGYNPGPVDGFIGPRTQEAVRAFQRDTGHGETGEITPELVEELRRADG